jgi:hypothetical protein
MSGYIYAIECGDAVKIGFARDPINRSYDLAIGSPHAQKLLGFIEGMSGQERELHQCFSAQRIRGEWFRRDGPVVNFFPRYRHGRIRELLH